MPEQDKPFVYYKMGMGVKISPRNAAGWRAFALWMLALFCATGIFIWASATAEAAGWDDGKILLLLVFPFVLATAIWALAMFRYMKARSEIVDIDSLLQLKQEQDAKKKRRGRF